MMSNNKILTVSYGTFSCTLEGFDDSFGTMKAIAEYFRDLASDDRYFGAEPPQPDAEMLARIAQKEISRRVEAHERDGRIVLSALEDQSDAPAEDAAPIASTAAVTAATVASAAAPVAEAPAPQPAPVVQEAPAPQAPPAAEAPTAPAPITNDAPTDDAPAPEVVATESPAVETPAVDTPVINMPPVDATQTHSSTADADQHVEEDENDIVPGQPDSEVEAFFADSPASELENDMLEEDDSTTVPLTLVASHEPEDTAPAATDSDSIAAKLERIRAVVARQSDADDDDDYLEDEHADIDAKKGADAADADENDDDGVIAQARNDIENALDADDAADVAEAAEAAQDDAAEDELTAILSRLDGSADAEDDDDDAIADAQTDDIQTDDAPDEEINSALENLFEGDGNDAVSTDTPRARVIKVKRADLEAAIEKGDLEEYDAGASQDAPAVDTTTDATVFEEVDAKNATSALDEVAPAKTPQSSLSAEEEADLVRELAELEADINGDAPDTPMPEAEDLVAEDVDHDFETPTRAEVQELDAEASDMSDDDITDDAADDDDKPAAKSVLPNLDEDSNSDMNRLLAETDSQMDEPESATRRDAFAHLRAAVAARKADDSMEADDAATKDANAYRSDLADVVRPRRPEAPSDSTRTARPNEGRPAPLKLVAEQRVDLDKPANAGPVRPRRVAAVADTPTEATDAESFADYASDLGATKLPELLEAAASYMSFVEGREEFSRPQLMTKVRQAGPSGDFSREDGLRSFGQLLRSGKIEKIKGGRFTVSDDIGYRPDEREAG